MLTLQTNPTPSIQQFNITIQQGNSGSVLKQTDPKSEQAQQIPSVEPQANRKGESNPSDKVSISPEGKAQSKGKFDSELTEEEKKVVEELKKVDQETRSHEQAHMGAGGQYASGATFEYEQGPDNKRYAVAGEVQIDTSAIPGDPAATKMKMRQVRRAALAPAKPSSQDYRVAAQAAQMENEAARQEVELKQKELEGKNSKKTEPGNTSKNGKPEEAKTANPDEGEKPSPFANAFAVKSYSASSASFQTSVVASQNKALSIFA